MSPKGSDWFPRVGIGIFVPRSFRSGRGSTPVPLKLIGARLRHRVDAAAGEPALPDVVGRHQQLQLFDRVEADRLRFGLAGRRACCRKTEQVVVDGAVDLNAVVAIVAAGHRQRARLGVDGDRREVRRRAREVLEAARHGRQILRAGRTTRLPPGPVRDGLIIGSTSASTVTVSRDRRQRQLEVEVERLAERHRHVDLLLRCGIPSRFAVIVYGPPMRTLEIRKRPSVSVTAEYCVPVGPWTASIGGAGQHGILLIDRDAADRSGRDVLTEGGQPQPGEPSQANHAHHKV